MNQSTSIGALAAALAKAQSEILNARKDAENPYFKSRYADLASVWEACRGPLSSNGLAIVQTTEATEPDRVTLCTTLMHASGEWISGCLTAKPTKSDPQSLGSCITYLRRYALAAMAGVAPSGEDDDGNLASQPGREHHAPEAPAKTAHQRLNDLVPTQKEQEELRDYLRSVPGKSGHYGLKADQELFAVTPELANYMVQNWSKVRTAVMEWLNQVPGAEMPEAPAESSWRNAKLPYTPKAHPELKGKTIGEAFDSESSRKWAFGMLMNHKAEPWTDNEGQERPPSATSVALEVAARQWRIENGKETPEEA